MRHGWRCWLCHDWVSCTFEVYANECANRLVHSVTAQTWPTCFCWVSVCVRGGLSGRGTGSAWTSGQEGENEWAKKGMMITEKVKCLKELERKVKGKQLENRFYKSFILGVFNIWGTVAFDLLLFCSLVFCSWPLKYLCYSALMVCPLYTFVIFVCHVTKAAFMLLMKTKCWHCFTLKHSTCWLFCEATTGNDVCLVVDHSWLSVKFDSYKTWHQEFCALIFWPASRWKPTLHINCLLFFITVGENPTTAKSL